jgi:hypothetical protein
MSPGMSSTRKQKRAKKRAKKLQKQRKKAKIRAEKVEKQMLTLDDADNVDTDEGVIYTPQDSEEEVSQKGNGEELKTEPETADKVDDTDTDEEVIYAPQDSEEDILEIGQGEGGEPKIKPETVDEEYTEIDHGEYREAGLEEGTENDLEDANNDEESLEAARCKGPSSTQGRQQINPFSSRTSSGPSSSNTAVSQPEFSRIRERARAGLTTAGDARSR